MSILGIVLVIFIVWLFFGAFHVVAGTLFNVLVIVLVIALIVAVLNVLRDRRL
jgi:hypothetical protein